MLQYFILNIKNTIDIILPNKELEFYATIMDKFINMSIGLDSFGDLMDGIDPSWNR